mgnify:CR=1 FL=1|tara:strand:+ start:444 stop:626 length:183 start_codon:yes stop_codon:yes gene_type:complete
MEIKNAQYIIDNVSDSTDNIAIVATIDGTSCTVPLDSANRHYAEILRQVKEEGLTIKDAD